jgi:hypothetical protein
MMHIHGPQMNPYATLDALRSAQKTAARREAELVRKELLESASEFAGESELSDACVIKIEERRESQGQPRRRNQQKERTRPQQGDSTGSEGEGSEAGDRHISDWA